MFAVLTSSASATDMFAPGGPLPPIPLSSPTNDQSMTHPAKLRSVSPVYLPKLVNLGLTSFPSVVSQYGEQNDIRINRNAAAVNPTANFPVLVLAPILTTTNDGRLFDSD